MVENKRLSNKWPNNCSLNIDIYNIDTLQVACMSIFVESKKL